MVPCNNTKLRFELFQLAVGFEKITHCALVSSPIKWSVYLCSLISQAVEKIKHERCLESYEVHYVIENAVKRLKKFMKILTGV